MAAPTPEQFRDLNKVMVTMFRLGLGPLISNSRSGYIMVLTTVGRKSGLLRRTPVNYAIINEDVFCTAGFGEASDWYRNLQADPAVEVWIGNRWWTGRAEIVSGDDSQRLNILRQVWINSGFAAEAFEGIDPKTCSDDELAEVAESVPVVRIRRAEELSGYGGPGDLAWMWPVAFVLLAAIWLLRPWRRLRLL